MPNAKLATIIPSAIITAVCLTVQIFFPCDIVTGTKQHSILLYALCYSFSHANWLHLLINLYALWLFRPRPFTCLIAILSAIFSSLILSSLHFSLFTLHFPLPIGGAGEGLYVGLSGFLFAAVARYYVSWSRPIWFPILINLALLLANIIFSFFPSPSLQGGQGWVCSFFAWHIHLLAFFLSYIFWILYYRKKRHT